MNKIFCGDSLNLEFIKTIIPQNSMSSVITDPPYNMTKFKWDTAIDFDKFWEVVKYCIKDGGNIIIFSQQPFTSKLILSNEKMFKYSLIWKKNRISDFLNAKKKILNIHEDILVFCNKSTKIYNPQFSYDGKPYVRKNKERVIDDSETTYNNYIRKEKHECSDGRRYPTSVLEFNRVERKKHPAEKPIDLLEYLVKTFTNEGDSVLDLFCGSGSTLKAALNCNRSYIGVDNDSSFCEMSAESLLIST